MMTWLHFQPLIASGRIAIHSFLITVLSTAVPLLAQYEKGLSPTMPFIGKYCADCHDDQTLKAGLNLTHLRSSRMTKPILPLGSKSMIASTPAKCRRRKNRVLMRVNWRCS
jgi:hypothetical protein